MCGILGSVNKDFDQETLDLIKHRGPDYGKIITLKNQEATITLAHRRLSIVDLSPSGNQPMINSHNKNVIIFNGEIYNHELLKESLSEYNFKGHSDTETILYYLSKYGIDSVEKFNGIFAFAFLDFEKGKLFLARDPYGVKPLYYSIQENSIVFSSEIRALKDLISTEISKDNLAQLLKLRYSPSPDTLHKNILKLRPGHILEFDLKNYNVSIKSFQKAININTNSSYNQYVDQYGVLLEKAVDRQLMSDVEIGVLLSGGIDSALITHFMVNKSPKKIKSFTVGFEEHNGENELDEAKETADLLGTQHTEVILHQENFTDIFEKIIEIVEEPLGTTSTIPMYFLNEEVSKHLKVVLTGQGADEPLGGYTRYKGVLLSEKIPTQFFKLLKPISPFIKNEKISRAINAFGENERIKKLENSYMLFNNEEILNLINITDNKSYSKIKYFYDELKGEKKHLVEAMMSIDSRMNLADDLLLYTDKISMHFGIETRVPFLDHDLMEFLEALPYQYKIYKGNSKFIHREFAKSLLPKKIIERKKKGFHSPTNQWFKDRLGQLLISEINQNQHFSAYFNKKDILNLIKSHKQGFNKEKQLFLLLSLVYWFKQNNI
jgi:asparagine synthase (glutamine-hydrolysing)